MNATRVEIASNLIRMMVVVVVNMATDIMEVVAEVTVTYTTHMTIMIMEQAIMILVMAADTMVDATAVDVILNVMVNTVTITIKTMGIIHPYTHTVVPTTLMMTRIMVIIRKMIIMKRNMMKVLRGTIIIMPANPKVRPWEAVVFAGLADTVVVDSEMKWLILVCKISSSVNKIN